ncbi:hypothetical protein BJ508DRAFT_330004 [Ascobolus immersus RN42]|uniref:Uncharacterized protein n=1 Tax=Ascobolus immersus RN42 TaxID=1160509 RepID=A0A3N4I0K4_ASCIM|nr:hypothetical protein BJ508DRAFT_330004 [Ascobolus immersus RN42]
MPLLPHPFLARDKPLPSQQQVSEWLPYSVMMFIKQRIPESCLGYHEEARLWELKPFGRFFLRGITEEYWHTHGIMGGPAMLLSELVFTLWLNDSEDDSGLSANSTTPDHRHMVSSDTAQLTSTRAADSAENTVRSSSTVPSADSAAPSVIPAPTPSSVPSTSSPALAVTPVTTGTVDQAPRTSSAPAPPPRPNQKRKAVGVVSGFPLDFDGDDELEQVPPSRKHKSRR